MGKEQTSPQIQTLVPLEQVGYLIEYYLRKHYGESLAEEALDVWELYRAQFHPNFRKAVTHAAAFLYAYLRLRLPAPPSQQAIADALQAPVGSLGLLGQNYREALRQIHIENTTPPYSPKDLACFIQPTKASPATTKHTYQGTLDSLASSNHKEFLQERHRAYGTQSPPKPPRTPAPQMTLQPEQYNLLLRLPTSQEIWMVGTAQPPPYIRTLRGADLFVLWTNLSTKQPLYIEPTSSDEAAHCLFSSFVEAATAPREGHPRRPKQIYVTQRHWLEPFRALLSPLQIDVQFDQTETFTKITQTLLLPTTHFSMLSIPHPHPRTPSHELLPFYKTARKLYEIPFDKVLAPHQPFAFQMASHHENAWTLCSHTDNFGESCLLLFPDFETWWLFATRCHAPESMSHLSLPHISALILYFPPYDRVPHPTRKLYPSHPPKRVPLLCEWLFDQQILYHATKAQHTRAHLACQALLHALQHQPSLFETPSTTPTTLHINTELTKQPLLFQVPHPSLLAEERP